MSRIKTSLIWVSAGVATVAGVGYFFWPEFVKLEELRREEKRLRMRIEVEERKNQLLQREEEELRNNPDTIEKVAREKLGLVKPGELLYKFEDDENKKE